MQREKASVCFAFLIFIIAPGTHEQEMQTSGEIQRLWCRKVCVWLPPVLSLTEKREEATEASCAPAGFLLRASGECFLLRSACSLVYTDGTHGKEQCGVVSKLAAARPPGQRR